MTTPSTGKTGEGYRNTDGMNTRIDFGGAQ